MLQLKTQLSQHCQASITEHRVVMDGQWSQGLQGDEICNPILRSLIPMHFTIAKAFNFAPQFSALKNPTWVIMWHSSNCRLLSDLAALAKETCPLTDKHAHLWRQNCLKFGQPLRTSSSHVSVTHRQDVIEKNFNFYSLWPFDKSLSVLQGPESHRTSW